jgi:hypothetical protein
MCCPHIEKILEEILYLENQALFLIHILGTGGDEDAVVLN